MKRLTRDVILFAVGLAGIVYETIYPAADPYPFLALFGAMIGLPLFLRADERRNGGPPKDKRRLERTGDVESDEWNRDRGWLELRG